MVVVDEVKQRDEKIDGDDRLVRPSLDAPRLMLPPPCVPGFGLEIDFGSGSDLIQGTAALGSEAKSHLYTSSHFNGTMKQHEVSFFLFLY